MAPPLRYVSSAAVRETLEHDCSEIGCDRLAPVYHDGVDAAGVINVASVGPTQPLKSLPDPGTGVSLTFLPLQ